MFAHDYIAIAQGREVTPEKYRDFAKLSSSPSNTNNAAQMAICIKLLTRITTIDNKRVCSSQDGAEHGWDPHGLDSGVWRRCRRVSSKYTITQAYKVTRMNSPMRMAKAV